MTAEELEQQAERAVRRGELLVALEHFEAYLAQEPDDDRVRQRMESVRALLQPSELVSRRRSEPEPIAQDAQPELSDAEQGEMLASAGRFAEAAAAYERALAANPKSELLRERLHELRALAHPSQRADLRAAEPLESQQGGSRPAPASRSAKASAASFAPLPEPLPKDKVGLLQELLGRVRAGRRG